MSYVNIFKICFVLIFAPGFESLSITNLAVPTSVQAGENVELQCRYDIDPKQNEIESAVVLKWWWTPLLEGPDERRIIYQRIGRFPPQSVHFNMTVKPHDTIELLDMQPENSGVFECQVSIIDEIREDKKLVVYTQGSGPNITTTQLPDDDTDEDEDDEILVTCAAYGAAPEPELSLSINGKSINSTHWTSEPTEGKYDVIANATVELSEIDGAYIKCEMFFEDESIAHPAYEVGIQDFDLKGETTTVSFDNTTEESQEEPSEIKDGCPTLASSIGLVLLAIVMCLNDILIPTI